jgi:hypothetical protein
MSGTQHARRIRASLAQVAAKHGYAAEGVTTRTPLDALLEAEEAAAGPEGERADVLKKMMHYFYADGKHPGAVLRRVFGLAKAIAPELLGDMTLAELGLMFGETRAAQQWRIKKIFSDYQKGAGAKGFKARFQKSEAASAAAARAQRGNQNRRKK